MGNHEFDMGPDKTAEFARNITFPMLSSNMVFYKDKSALNRHLVKKSMVKTIGGEKIGVVGYSTEETPDVSQSGKFCNSSNHKLQISGCHSFRGVTMGRGFRGGASHFP